MCVTKQSSRCVLFVVSHVIPSQSLPQKKITRFDDFFVHAFTAKNKFHEVTFFLLHTFTTKTKLHKLPQKKKLHDVTIFSDTRLPQKENACLQAMCPPVDLQECILQLLVAGAFFVGFFLSLFLFPVLAHWMLPMALSGLFSWA